MNLVFIIKNRDNTPFMVVSTTPEGSTFKPMTEAAKELAVMLRQEYGKTPITKPELVQTMDSSKIIEGPSPSGSALEKKVASLALLKSEIVETKNLTVLSISEVLLSEFSNEEFRNVLSFKASSFISDQTQSSFNFEIKGVRALWDPSLSIPGTNRRGGWRCPVGTRYGGQITDRFGRSCGWGVARRIANQISDIGERLEQRDDGKRKRRLDRRNARMVRRLGGVPEAGRIEGGLRGIAERLEGGDTPKPRRVRGGVRPRAADVWNASNVGRAINAEFGGGRRRGDAQPEVDAPSTRVPRNRRRDVIPETAPTPKPKPRPARRPAPAGRRQPQARPRVVPQSESVDVLTAREASDAGASEDFKPYVLRKYDEYAKRVREIREGGGNAGMLTRREWYAINKPNLRDAWKDAHGRSAPQDFEPPTPQPRRPRNNRRRRKKATTAGAGRSATRKPTPDDVPEPAPARPVRPARPARRPRRSPDGRDPTPPAPANQQSDSEETTNRVIPLAGMFDLGDIDEIAYVERFDDIDPNVPSQGVNGRGQIRWNPDIVKAFDKAEEKIRELNLQNTHMPVYLANAVFVVRKADAKAVEEAFLSARQGNLFGYRDVNADAFPDTNIGETPKTPPAPARAPRAPQASQKSPLRRFKREGNPHGVLPIDRSGGGMGKFKKTEDPSIDSVEKAIEHIKNGGDLGKVPPKYMFDAIFANSSKDETDMNSRFRSVAPDGGIIGFTQMFFLRGEDGKRTHQGWVFKASRPADNVGELVGWNYLAAVGILEDGAIADGKVPPVSQEVLDRLEPRNARRIAGDVGKQFVVTPMVFNDIPNDHKIGVGVGQDFVKGQLQEAPDRGLPARLSNLLASFILGVSDRHNGNGMGRIVELPDGTKKVIVVPMDLGWSGQDHGKTFTQYQNGFRMDEQFVSQEAARELQQIADVNVRKKTYQEMIKTFDEIEAKTAQVINAGRVEFIKNALKNQSPTATNKERAGKLFDGMADNLIALRLQRRKIVDLLPAGER